MPKRSFQCLALVAAMHFGWTAPTKAGDFIGDAPWEHADAVVVLDAYSPNTFNLPHVLKDSHHPAALIWQATKGQPSAIKTVCNPVAQIVTVDCRFEQMLKLSAENKVLFGAYHFGHTGHVRAQAVAFADTAKKYNLKFLALDVDGEATGVDMTIPEAQDFLNIVSGRIGIMLVLYTTRNVADRISRSYDKRSVFARTLLWIAAPAGEPSLRLAPIRSRVWDKYSLWQFNDDKLCVPAKRKKYLASHPHAPPCPIRMNEIGSGYDISLFNGSRSDLKKLF